MPSHADIPDRVRDFLASEGRRWDPELTDLAVAHAALCREARGRLRRCQDYLRRGMRSEAVHLAGCQPPLPELLELLDFPEAGEWAEACAANGVPPPPRVAAAAAAAELRAATGRERELAALLEAHRALALAAAPVPERLAAARALAARDPGNPCWAEAVRELEPARLRELRARAKAAFRADDGPALDAVAAELAETAWAVEVPEDLRVGLGRAIRQTRRRAAAGELAFLAGEIEAAAAAGDADRCEAMARAWEGTLARFGTTAPGDLRDRVAPALQWLATERRRREIGDRVRAAKNALEETADPSDPAAAQRPRRGWFGWPK